MSSASTRRAPWLIPAVIVLVAAGLVVASILVSGRGETDAPTPSSTPAADVVGPDVKFHHAKLNVKAGKGSREFKWHQDIQSWPHTDYSPVTVGVYIDGCGPEQGPLAFVPGSHEGELFSHYNDKDEWVGAIQKRDFERAGIDNAVYLTGRAGTITIHSARAVHGSAQNESNSPRPLLLHMYTSGDASRHAAAKRPLQASAASPAIASIRMMTCAAQQA